MEWLDHLLTFDLKAFTSIVFIDLVMSGDNAIIIGLAAAGLPAEMRRRAIMLGILGATVLRITFSIFTFQLLHLIGMTLAGGILLLWVAYKMWREIQCGAVSAPCAEEISAHDGTAGIELSDGGGGAGAAAVQTKTMGSAMFSIIIADVTMSLDNVLAVAGAAHGAPGMLVFGLVLSIVLMACAANYLACMLERHRWLAYAGLLVVAYVAVEMIWRGSGEVFAAMG